MLQTAGQLSFRGIKPILRINGEVRLNKKILLWSGILPVFLLVVSLALFFLFNNNRQERTFYFHEQGTGKEIGELRTIPRYHDPERNVKVYVEELLLGPQRMNMVSVFPEGTKLNQLMLREKKLYIDINNMVLKTDIIKSYNIGKNIKLLRKNIIFNFPEISDIIFTITGEEPEIVEAE